MNSLPPETRHLILSFLDDKNKRVLRTVSLEWFNLIKYNKFTLYMTKKADLPKISERFSNYPWPIELSFKKPQQLSYDSLKNYISRITTLTGLNLRAFNNGNFNKEDSLPLTALTNLSTFDGMLRMDLMGHFTNLTRIKLFETMFYAKLMEKFQMYTKLESVSLCFDVYKQDDIFQYFSNPTRLTALSLKIYGLKNTENTSRFVNLKFLNHETSEKLTLKFPSLEELRSNRPDLLIGLEQCTKLTRLDLVEESSRDNSDFALYATSLKPLTKLKKLRIENKFNSNIDQTMKSLAVLTDLEEFTFYPFFGSHFFNDVFSYMNSKKLTKLSCLLHNDKLANGNSTMSCIRQIGMLTTLKELYMRVDYDNNGLFAKKIDYDPLRNLTNLTKIKLVTIENKPNLQVISKLTNLRDIQLQYIEANLSALTNLEKLVTYDITKISLDSIQNLTRLTCLHVSVDSSHKINPNALSKLFSLRSLKIRPSKSLADWQNLTLLTDLNELWISEFDTAESIQQLSSLQKLTYLQCIGSKCSLTSFTVLTSLQKLQIESAKMNKESKNAILKALPNLRDWALRGEGGFDLGPLNPEDRENDDE